MPMLENPVFHNALGSATSGIIARIITHPLDTAKARLQAPPSPTHPLHPPYRGTIDVLLRTVQTEGISALYRGFGAVLIGGTPGTMIYLCGYDYFNGRLREMWQRRRWGGGGGGDDRCSGGGGGGGKEAVGGPLVPFCAGMIAETLACVIYVPVDVVKERLQVQRVLLGGVNASEGGGGSSQHGRRVMNGSWDALRTILRTEGWRGVYKGYAATLASFGPFSALYFVFYERMKVWSRELAFRSEEEEEGSNTGSQRDHRRTMGDDGSADMDTRDDSADTASDDKDLPFHYIVASSATAGAAAAWLTSPLDMAKLRIQIQRGSSSNATSAAAASTYGMTYNGMVDCLKQTYGAEGVRGLFRGSVARVVHFAPCTAITMTCYEMCRSFYKRVLTGD